MDDPREDDPPPYFGNYPDGPYWAAYPTPGKRVSNGPAPWVRTEPRTPEEPYPLRMFAEDSCEFALWGPLDEPPPGVERDRPGLLEDQIPISADLRDRLVEWARQNTLVRSDFSASELDWMGYHLSRELAETLGELYSVTYSPTCAGRHRARIRARAEQEPLAGWRLSTPGEGG